LKLLYSRAKLVFAALLVFTLTSASIAHAQATPAAPLAALINGKLQITMATLTTAVNRQLDARRTVGDAMPADLRAFQETVLTSLIEQALIEEAARIQGITVTDADLDAEIASYTQAAGGREKLLASIAADKMSEAEWRAGVRNALVTNKIRDVVTRGVPTATEMVHARHILVTDLNTANTIAAQLKAGSDFAKLAAQYSLDLTTKTNGGDLGWFPRGQLLQKSVEDAAFVLQPSQISGPIQSDLGFHIIQVTERAKDRPIDPQTRAQLQEAVFEAWVASLVKQANIVRYPAQP